MLCLGISTGCPQSTTQLLVQKIWPFQFLCPPTKGILSIPPDNPKSCSSQRNKQAERASTPLLLLLRSIFQVPFPALNQEICCDLFFSLFGPLPKGTQTSSTPCLSFSTHPIILFFNTRMDSFHWHQLSRQVNQQITAITQGFQNLYSSLRSLCPTPTTGYGNFFDSNSYKHSMLSK